MIFCTDNPSWIKAFYKITRYTAFLTIILVNQYFSPHIAKSTEVNAALAWSENTSVDEKVFVTTFGEGRWSLPVQLSASGKMSFHPSAGVNQKEELWVVWSLVDNGKTNLYYTVEKNGQWRLPQLYNTGLSNNKSAVLIFEHNIYPILVWSAINEKYPDIFWAIYEDGKWSSPKRVHPTNDVPDIDPRLFSDKDGSITLLWKTVKEGQYIISSARYYNRNWEIEDTSQIPADIGIRHRRLVGDIPPLPKFIKDKRKANIFVNDSGRSINIPALAE